MDKEKVYHLSYVSTGCDNLNYDHIKDILDYSIEYNKEHDITGILLYCNKHFFQIIEGPEHEVKALFENIMIDSRHDNIIKLQEGYFCHRQFEKWHMAFKSYNCELKKLDNFNNEQFYNYITTNLCMETCISNKVLADFFDLNG